MDDPTTNPIEPSPTPPPPADVSPLSTAAVTTPRSDVGGVVDVPPEAPTPINKTALGDAGSVEQPPAPPAPPLVPPTSVETAPPPEKLSDTDRITLLEEEVAFLRELYGWPTKDDIQ